MRRFHRPSRGVMLATQSMKRELAARGFENLVDWTRGVDTALFRPDAPKAQALLGLPRPIHLYVARKSVVSGKSVSVRVDLGGRRIIKKKHARQSEQTTMLTDINIDTHNTS